MKSAARVIAYLDDRGVIAALIGGIALGAHGIARATLDADVLVGDAAVLDGGFWAASPELASPEIRRGDDEDPLLGIVRFALSGEPVDVVVGRGRWIARILERRLSIAAAGHTLPVVDRADLVLLKLFAGGPQDLVDVRLLVQADPAILRREVEERLDQAPAVVREAWDQLAAAGFR